MPIYEYECQQCGYHHEVLQKISDGLLTTCPSCNAEALRKLVSAAGFRLSGSGWYETDFKSGDNKKNLTQKDADKSKDSKKDNKKEKKKGDNKSTSKSSSTANTTKKSSSNASS